jgi:hypothetical protein
LAALAVDIKASADIVKKKFECELVGLEAKFDSRYFSINVDTGSFAADKTCFEVDIVVEVATKDVVSIGTSKKRINTLQSDAHYEIR